MRSTLVNAGDYAIEPEPYRRQLLTWGRDNFRPFPWRYTRDPYRVLIAEVMLHRTQASQVVPVFERFMDAYPNVRALSQANKEELLHVLYPLGLRWRAGLVHDMAAELSERFGGLVPRERSDLLSLPGVSDYIAGATRCFAWGLPDPIIDTNTVRVTGRLFGLDIKDSSRRNQLYRRLIASLVDSYEPRAYNFALLDLAHFVCTKVRAPKCGVCPIREHCRYGTDPSTPKDATNDGA